MRRIKNQKGQALAEMALFGSLILMLFAALLSYLQRSNDQQYVQMESFRRALAKGNTAQGDAAEGAGASVQLTLLQNRRYSDLSEAFRKGSPQALSASSNVFWAVPKVGSKPDNAIVFKVNDDEKEIINDTVKVDNIDSSQKTSFEEANIKQETPSAITNTRTSKLKDTVTTKFLDKEGNLVWEVTQGAYRDEKGQYRYSESEVDNEITRGKSWRTEFK